MSDALTIRPLRTDDAAQWRTIRLEALKAHPIAFQSSHEEAATKDIAFFAARIPPANSESVLFGAFIGGNLVGTCGFQVLTGPKQRHKAQVWGMYVTPAARRHGTGAALVQAAIDHARTRVAIVSLVVSMENAPARTLYRRMGFVPYGVEKRALRHEGVDHDDELMALDLANGL